MKVLSVVWFKIFPAKYGGQKGIACFEEELAKSFDLTCICSANNSLPDESGMQILPVLPISKWQCIYPTSIHTILRHIKKNKPNILLLEHPYYGIAAILAKKLYGTTLVLHQHNIEFQRFKALGYWWWPFLRIFEKWVNKQADLILVKTEADKKATKHFFSVSENKCMLLPYGITEKEIRKDKDKAFFDRHKIDYCSKIILFAGTLDYKPNANAVAGIFNHLVPLFAGLPYTFIICGRNELEKFSYLKHNHHHQVVMAGAVEEIDEYFFNADVFINPVLTGGGIQTKNLDALSYHCPVVSFENGLTGINRTVTKKLYAVKNNDWTGMADCIQTVIQLPKTEVEKEFFTMYSWEHIIEPLVNHLKEKHYKA